MSLPNFATRGKNETVICFMVIIFHMISSVSTLTHSSGWAAACLLSHLPPLVFNLPEEETKMHQLMIPNAGGMLPALAMDTG
jgi:hypothetical protein